MTYTPTMTAQNVLSTAYCHKHHPEPGMGRIVPLDAGGHPLTAGIDMDPTASTADTAHRAMTPGTAALAFYWAGQYAFMMVTCSPGLETIAHNVDRDGGVTDSRCFTLRHQPHTELFEAATRQVFNMYQLETADQ